MTFFRVDQRDFQVGDKIETAREFTKKNPRGSEIVERVFREHKPEHLPDRTECLFVFEKINDAYWHWAKMSNGKLYEVAVDAILLSSDMRLVDEAFVHKEDIEAVASFAKRYWSGEDFTHKPRVEVLASFAIVTGIISKNEQERLQKQRELWLC